MPNGPIDPHERFTVPEGTEAEDVLAALLSTEGAESVEAEPEDEEPEGP